MVIGVIGRPGRAGGGRSLGKIDLLRSDPMTKKGLRPTGAPPGGRILGVAGRMAGIRCEDSEVL